MKITGIIEGPITSDFVAAQMESLGKMHHCGAVTHFCGQVRADEIEGKQVAGIEYSSYGEMAEKVLLEIRELILKDSEVSEVRIFHSTGRVKVGELSLFIAIAAGHSKMVYGPLQKTVDLVKQKVPVWKQEWFGDGDTRWVEGKGMG